MENNQINLSSGEAAELARIEMSHRERFVDSRALYEQEVEERFNLLRRQQRTEEVQRCIMPYEQFLQTDYWKNVRAYMIMKAHDKCQLCSANSFLQVHHNSYEHRGMEWQHLEDLVVLCDTCHGRHHGK